MVRNLFKQAGIYFFGSMVSKVVITIAWIALARVLSPDKYGQFTLYYMILQIITFVGDFGLNQWYLKNVDPNNRNSIFNKILYVRSLTLLISLFFLAFLLFLLKKFDLLSSILLVASLIPMAYLSVIDGYYLEQKKGFLVSLKLTSIGFIFLFIYYFIFQNLDLQKAVLAFFSSLSLTLFWFIPWKEIKLRKTMTLTEVISTLKESAAYLYLTLTSFFYNRGDSFIISYFKGDRALGLYGLAYRFLESLALFSSAITQNLFPLSAKKDGITLTELLKISFMMLFSGLTVALLVFISSNWLILTIFGVQYSEAVPILKIFSVVLLLFFVNAPLATVVQSSSMVKKFLPYGILNTLLNIVLNILTVPVYGIVAAAWIMLVTELTGLLINIYFVNKLYRIRHRNPP